VRSAIADIRPSTIRVDDGGAQRKPRTLTARPSGVVQHTILAHNVNVELNHNSFNFANFVT
jgi:hypothetical protein